VQYAMLQEDDEDGDLPKAITPINSNKIHKSTVEEILNRKRQDQSGQNKLASAPHMTTEEAQEEISRLQKVLGDREADCRFAAGYLFYSRQIRHSCSHSR